MYMDDFILTKIQVQDQFKQMIRDADVLLRVDVNKEEFWNLYLDTVPEEENFFFRERRSNDCSACRHFFNTIGNVVVIKDSRVHTLWEFEAEAPAYRETVAALDRYLKERPVSGLYLSPSDRVGVDKNYEKLENGEIQIWDHFYLEVPKKFVEYNRDMIPGKQAEFRSVHDVFERSLREISMHAIRTVLDLIDDKNLYRGEEWLHMLTRFRQYKSEYDALDPARRANYVWEHASSAGITVGKIRNHSIGVLLQDITEDMELDAALRKYESIVAPSNYKRPKPVFTKAMLEKARTKLAEMNYLDALPRRFATLDDISVNNILFSNRDAARRIRGAMDVFGEMMSEASDSAEKISHAVDISIEDFISTVLPKARYLEAYLENRHSRNMVSLIAPQNPDAASMFKWNNAFSWAYTGNITDSSMKQNVKNAGGKVDGELRFSIQWNEDGRDNCDLDAHCTEPGGNEIYFGKGRKPYFSPTGGQLDVDIIYPNGKVAVENITWASRDRMTEGKYLFQVHQYSGSARGGFRAEIEFDGTVYSYDYNKPVSTDQTKDVAEVTLDRKGNFSIKEMLPSSVSSREIWGVHTNEFVPVSVMMYSPNYWDEQQGIGNKHYMFMLKGCVSQETPNGFYNEFLKSELMEHRHVLEALGGKMAVEVVEDQMSGLGFSSTQRNDLVVKVTGNGEKTYRIQF